MMKITGLSHLFKWENLHNWWLTKYFFAPLYIYIYIYIYCKNDYNNATAHLKKDQMKLAINNACQKLWYPCMKYI